jgi:Tol biopolymer transport system component
VEKPAWSPDGGHIAFVRTSYDEPTEVWISEADGTRFRRLLPDVGQRSSAPAWSPDGSMLALEGLGGVFVVNSGGSGQRLIASGHLVDPEWTPNGGLAYTRLDDGRTRLFVTDGGVERQLIPDAQSPANPNYRDEQVAWRR